MLQTASSPDIILLMQAGHQIWNPDCLRGSKMQWLEIWHVASCLSTTISNQRGIHIASVVCLAVLLHLIFLQNC